MPDKGRRIGINRVSNQLFQQVFRMRRHELWRFRHCCIGKVLFNLFQRGFLSHHMLRQKIQNIVGKVLFNLCQLGVFVFRFGKHTKQVL